jgi:DNA-binding response OmpR family regulator
MSVLLVEDDAILRLTLYEVLLEAGLRVLDASDAEAALAILDSRPAGIMVLVTDLDLGPGRDGLALAAEARCRLPGLRVVYATGSPERLAHRRLATWERLFAKPLDIAALTVAVHALVHGRRRPFSAAGS